MSAPVPPSLTPLRDALKEKIRAFLESTETLIKRELEAIKEDVAASAAALEKINTAKQKAEVVERAAEKLTEDEIKAMEAGAGALAEAETALEEAKKIILEAKEAAAKKIAASTAADPAKSAAPAPAAPVLPPGPGSPASSAVSGKAASVASSSTTLGVSIAPQTDPTKKKDVVAIELTLEQKDGKWHWKSRSVTDPASTKPNWVEGKEAGPASDKIDAGMKNPEKLFEELKKLILKTDEKKDGLIGAEFESGPPPKIILTIRVTPPNNSPVDAVGLATTALEESYSKMQALSPAPSTPAASAPRT